MKTKDTQFREQNELGTLFHMMLGAIGEGCLQLADRGYDSNALRA